MQLSYLFCSLAIMPLIKFSKAVRLLRRYKQLSKKKMKKYNHSLTGILLIGFLLFAGCKKTTITSPAQIIGGTNHPNFICQHQPASASLNGQFVFFDLDHDANKDKKYFIVALQKNGLAFGDSCDVIQAPKPIDSLALNWPAQIKAAAFGTTRNILTDAKNAVTFSAPDPWIYNQLNNTTNLYRKLNDPVYAAAKAGAKPFGNNPYSTNYYPQATYTDYRRAFRDIVYYFKDGIYTDNSANGGVKLLDTLFVGANAINWISIDHTVYVDFERINSPNRYFRKYFYFDFTNWKYYTVNETEARKDYLSYPSVNFIQWEVKVYSLNSFCKWPVGWGKK